MANIASAAVTSFRDMRYLREDGERTNHSCNCMTIAKWTRFAPGGCNVIHNLVQFATTFLLPPLSVAPKRCARRARALDPRRHETNRLAHRLRRVVDELDAPPCITTLPCRPT